MVSLSKKTFKDLINKYKLFIFDCDGVIWIEYDIFEESAQCLKALHSSKKQIRFLTNNNSKSTISLYEPFKKHKDLCSIITPDQIYSAGVITASYISTKYPSCDKIYVFGTDELANEFKKKNIKVISSSVFDDKYSISAEKADVECQVERDIKGVVAGADVNINYYKLLYAQRVLDLDNTQLFGTNIDWKKKGLNGNLLGSFSFINFIQTFSNKQAEIVSKPNPYCLDMILNEVNKDQVSKGLETIERKDILMIGDSLQTDIKFANNVGIDSALVFTGITNIELLDKVKDDSKYGNPTYVFNNLKVI